MHALAESPGVPMARPMSLILTGLISVYQKTVSPLLGPRCRFYPSCSEYARLCLGKYPLSTATAKTAGRLLRCHPFHPGGIDLP